MNQRLILITKLSGLLFLTAPATALAYDFVFTVPIEIRNVHPDVHGIEFACETLSAAGEVVGRGGALPLLHQLFAGLFRPADGRAWPGAGR